ncbi:MAG: biopolymer transporter ExbD [Bacteroidales bacterium]|nr:biopolymer transporter ExbD [Bacteroidales bacterium]
MALKRQHNMMAAFSMASMTDVIFLLLIFFMVTSTYIFPTALEVNLPQSSQQTTKKPTIRISVDAQGNISTAMGDTERQPIPPEQLKTWLMLAKEQAPEDATVALYADENASYGDIVKILNVGAEANISIVLATKPLRSNGGNIGGVIGNANGGEINGSVVNDNALDNTIPGN